MERTSDTASHHNITVAAMLEDSHKKKQHLAKDNTGNSELTPSNSIASYLSPQAVTTLSNLSHNSSC